MARGGQLFGAPAPQPTNWFGIIWKVLLGVAVIYILYLAFFKTCPTPVLKEKFESGCPCNKKGGSMFSFF